MNFRLCDETENSEETVSTHYSGRDELDSVAQINRDSDSDYDADNDECNDNQINLTRRRSILKITTRQESTSDLLQQLSDYICQSSE